MAGKGEGSKRTALGFRGSSSEGERTMVEGIISKVNGLEPGGGSLAMTWLGKTGYGTFT